MSGSHIVHHSPVAHTQPHLTEVEAKAALRGGTFKNEKHFTQAGLNKSLDSVFEINPLRLKQPAQGSEAFP